MRRELLLVTALTAPLVAVIGFGYPRVDEARRTPEGAPAATRGATPTGARSVSSTGAARGSSRRIPRAGGADRCQPFDRRKWVPRTSRRPAAASAARLVTAPLGRQVNRHRPI